MSRGLLVLCEHQGNRAFLTQTKLVFSPQLNGIYLKISSMWTLLLGMADENSSKRKQISARFINKVKLYKNEFGDKFSQ